MDAPHFRQTLDELDTAGLLRRLPEPIDSPQAPHVTVNGRDVILMASNNYLGLANHPAVCAAARGAIDRWGVGAGAARLVSGEMTPHRALEQCLAAFKRTEAALTFSTGYMANLGLISCLVPEDGLVLIDKLSHASLIDGARLAGRPFRVYPHAGLERLERLLAGRPAAQPALIVTDGVFSMDGGIAPLPELVRLAQHYGARVLLDDAHGTGVLGPNGRGCLEHFGLDGEHVVQMGTLSKALGSFGAYVAGRRVLIDYLINRCRPFIYTTALPPAVAAAAAAAIECVAAEPERRARLRERRAYLAKGLEALGFAPPHDPTPILPVRIGDSAHARRVAEALLQHGVLAPAIRPPTVARGTARLRLTVTADHTPADLDRVLGALAEVLAARGGSP
jgi:glycine C-acetyltransferase/8-amino-7-oxononanoate synthase